MKNNERSIKYFDLKISAAGKLKGDRTTSIPVLPSSLLDLAKEWARLLKQNGGAIQRDWGRQHWSFSELVIDEDEGAIAFLITRSDPEGADQAVLNPRARRFKVATKEREEGNAFSSHVVLKIESENGKDQYLTLMEDTPGIGAHHVEKTLGYVMAQYAQTAPKLLLRPAPNGAVDEHLKPVQMKLKYQFELRGHPSDDFKNELNDGVLNGIEVVKYKHKPLTWDDGKTAIEQRQVIHLTAASNSRSAKLFETLKSVCKTAASKDFETVRIKFKDSSDYYRSVALDPSTMSLLNEDRYIKKVRLEGFSAKLDTGYEKLQPELLGKMKYLLSH